MLMVKIPESVSEYYSNRAVQAAVDLLLLGKQVKNIDENYTWQEVRQFHQAYLSAQICRSSFIEMMLDIRDCLFLDNPEFEVGGTIKDSNPECLTVEEIWEDGEIYTYFVHADSKLEFTASLSVPEDKLWLQIAPHDDAVIKHQKMIFGPTWPEKDVLKIDGEYWFSTAHNLLEPLNKWKAEIDITPIKKALDDFINNIKLL